MTTNHAKQPAKMPEQTQEKPGLESKMNRGLGFRRPIIEAQIS